MTLFHAIRDRRGATALEFALVLLPLLMFIFGIFDVSRYALTWYSLNNLADEAIRRQTICYAPLIAQKAKSVPCLSDPFLNLDGTPNLNPDGTDPKKNAAPALFWGSLSVPSIITDPLDTTKPQSRTITASVSGFTPMMPLIPYPSTLTVKVNLPF